MSARGTRAIDVLRTAGVSFTVHEYDAGDRADHGARGSGRGARDERPSYGRDAAEALGIDPGRVFKTLIVSVDGRLGAALVPVSAELDLKRAADALRGRKVALADAATAERATGYVVGGISPFGQRRRLPAAVDASVTGHATVFVSGGRRGLQVELAPDDLVRLAGAVVAPLAR